MHCTKNNKKGLVFLVKARRELHGQETMSQYELAQKSGLTVETIRYYENCREYPRSIYSMRAIAQALGTTIDNLISPHVQ